MLPRAAAIVLAAHRELEKLVCTIHQNNFKGGLESQWAYLCYAGLWLEPLRRDIDAYMDSVNEFVTAYLQAEELGAPLADTLNQIATDMRRATAQRMRQHASKIEPRISLVMTMVLIPGALVILVGGMILAMGADQIGGMFGG